MQSVIVAYDFSKPPERIFAYLSEHENLAAVFGLNVERLRDGEDGNRNGVGSVRRLKAGPLPPFEETVTEFVPNELIRYRITRGGPLRHHRGELRFSSRADGGTRLDYEIHFGAAVPGLDRLVALGLRRNIPRGLAGVDSKA